MNYNKKEYKEKIQKRTKKLRTDLKKLETSLFTDIGEIDKIIESWKENDYKYS